MILGDLGGPGSISWKALRGKTGVIHKEEEILPVDGSRSHHSVSLQPTGLPLVFLDLSVSTITQLSPISSCFYVRTLTDTRVVDKVQIKDIGDIPDGIMGTEMEIVF